MLYCDSLLFVVFVSYFYSVAATETFLLAFLRASLRPSIFGFTSWLLLTAFGTVRSLARRVLASH